LACFESLTVGLRVLVQSWSLGVSVVRFDGAWW
jgi:hypothetical protein